MATLADQIATAIFEDGRTGMTKSALVSLLTPLMASFSGYAFRGGIVDLTTSPGPIPKKTVFVALSQGTYPGFADLSVDDGEIALFGWDLSSWSKTTVYTPASLYELKANKVTSLSEDSTDTQYPSAKAVRDFVMATSMKSVTWAQLKALRDAGALSPGTFYRITDYVATTTAPHTRSASHPFDIVVMAIDGSTLDEKGSAIQHEGDTYFNGQNLPSWQVWYCIDNDTDRFAWADETNGKGVVFRLIDDKNNDVPYDFKGIQFFRYDLVAGGLVWDQDVYDEGGARAILKGTIAGLIIADNTAHRYGFTYGYGDNERSGSDLIENMGTPSSQIDEEASYIPLNDIDEEYDGPWIFAKVVEDSGVWLYTFNTIAADRSAGQSDASLISGVQYNFIQPQLYNGGWYGSLPGPVVFGNYCTGTTLGDYCYGATLGDYCNGATLGNNCYGATVTGGTNSARVKNVVVEPGTVNVTITFQADKNYAQHAGLDSNGDLQIWVPADIAANV